MKKTIVLLLTLVSVMICFASCTPSVSPTTTPPQSTPPAQSEIPTEKYFIARYDDMCIYNSFIYYQTDYTRESTIKYQNLKNPHENSVMLYNDTFGGEDPFKAVADSFIIVDEKATAENGGMPVLIIAMNTYKNEDVGTDFKIVRFDQATNTLKVITEKTTGEKVNSAFLCGDTLYFQMWSQNEKEEYSFNYYKMNKDGGEITTLDNAIKTETEVLSIIGKTVYLLDSVAGMVYKTDINFESFEKMTKYSDICFEPYIADGFLYYADKYREVDVEGNKVRVSDVYRKPLEGFKEASPELIIENAVYARGYGSRIVYFEAGDSEFFKDRIFTVNKLPVLKLYDISTGNSTVLSDKRGGDENERHTGAIGCNADYIWYLCADGKYYFIDIQTNSISDFNKK